MNPSLSMATGAILMALLAMPAFGQSGPPGTSSTAPRAATPRAGAAGAVVPPRVNPPSVLPGTSPSTFSTIQGNALNSVNGALPDSLVRLRDARRGRIVDTQVTDKSGLFAFKAVDPGNYVVELIGADQSTILAASQLLSVNAGETVSAVVKLPFRIPPFGGLLGHTAASAAAVIGSAAATGVLAAVTTTEVSPDGTGN